MEDDYLELRPVSVYYGYCLAFASFLFFCLLRVVACYATPDSINEVHEKWKWRNVLLSWIHAVLIGIWVLTCFYFYPEMTRDLFDHQNIYTYSAVAFSTGYFLSDSFDMISNGQTLSKIPIAVHHVVVLWIFLYNLTHRTYIGYTIVALTVEINSIFLHLRKLMRMSKFNLKHHLLFMINSVVTLVTIITCRFTALAWISYGIITSSHRFSSIYLYLLSSSIGVMWIIYVIAFIQLLVKDFLHNSKFSIQKENSNNNRHLIEKSKSL